MESVGDVLKRQPSRFHYQDLVQKIMKDPDVAAFIQQESLTPEELNRSISKFNQYITERDKFLRGDTDYIAKGYKPILVMNHGYADVSYEETPELIAAEKEAAIKNRLKLINLPASLRKASLAQVDLDDLGRLPVFEKLLAFVEQYPTILKGLYLYGDFGVGKSFMVAALAHDLSERRGVSSTLLHYPSFVIDVKNAIGDGNVKTLVDEIKLSEVLILDDIGAEQSTAWVRDEILQVILQYRMQENLPTFFTSNFNFEDLEKHFAKVKHGNDETWEARRVMERIRYLAEETRLEGVNRR
ncbi:primosomal protein DnaI [Streptococcus mitis]|uniref:primosomal protein DnaI n=1 Tax=Streptococcus mitis TaxID=28037 RepID=UPI0039C06359